MRSQLVLVIKNLSNCKLVKICLSLLMFWLIVFASLQIRGLQVDSYAQKHHANFTNEIFLLNKILFDNLN